MIAVAIMALLTSIAYPAYTQYTQSSNKDKAVRDMREIEAKLERYFSDHYEYPEDLSDAGPMPLDPWGLPYEYLRMEGAAVGKVRKDHAQHPLNTDFDLYSKGADGKSATPLTAKISKDDIVRARNGGFVGLAADY